MAWLFVLGAAIIEVFWVVGLKHSDSFLDWSGTVAAIILSFYFIVKACEKLPAGTVYAVFTGSGAAAIVLVDYLVFEAAFSWQQLVFIGLIITGVIGIKVTTEEQEEPAHAEKGE
ncbi:DMT family transporter [Alteribacillus iranensis]|uniref:Paired small multidrug resistance pump n=1 Tax=Alteribacillus iranensis TaxID=930128 RepID=A0A1I2CPC8_9BACI|nr:multidrug efflux SMR transporter [Alteribacillus iranensis]SFE70197.1 paired small multidrug resistance pump [Alteribacillus iranensis]